MQNSYDDLKKYGLDDKESMFFFNFFDSSELQKELKSHRYHLALLFLFISMLYSFILIFVFYKRITNESLIFAIVVVLLLLLYWILNGNVVGLYRKYVEKNTDGYEKSLLAIDKIYTLFFSKLNLNYSAFERNVENPLDNNSMSFFKINERNTSYIFFSKNIQTAFTWLNRRNIYFEGRELHISSGKISKKHKKHYNKSYHNRKKNRLIWYLNIITFDNTLKFHSEIKIIKENIGLFGFDFGIIFKMFLFSMIFAIIISLILKLDFFLTWGILFIISGFYYYKSKKQKKVQLGNKILEKDYDIYWEDDLYIKQLEARWFFQVIENFSRDYLKSFDILLKDNKIYIKAKWTNLKPFWYKQSFIKTYQEFKAIRNLALDVEKFL